MAQLKDLLVNGNARIIGKTYGSEFVGCFSGTASNSDMLDGYHSSAFAVVNGNRGNMSGYCKTGTATTINATSMDCNETSSNVTISAGTAGTSWTKIVRLTAAVTITLATGWSWVGGSAPTISAGGILICRWCGSGGLVRYDSP